MNPQIAQISQIGTGLRKERNSTLLRGLVIKNDFALVRCNLRNLWRFSVWEIISFDLDCPDVFLPRPLGEGWGEGST
jgi:hypothetical protein